MCLKALFVLFLLPLCCAAQKPQFDSIKPDVVRIECDFDGSTFEGPKPASEVGTGLIVSLKADTVRIITALHVARGSGDVGRKTCAIRVTFSWNNVSPLPGTVLPIGSQPLDIALIDVTFPKGFHLPRTIQQLEWLSQGSMSQTMHVWTMNGDWTVAPNNIVRLDKDSDIRQFEYTTTSIGAGYSGAPVFDDYGRLIGIHQEQLHLARTYTLAAAVKIGAALEALDSLGYPTSSFNMLASAETMGNRRVLPPGGMIKPTVPILESGTTAIVRGASPTELAVASAAADGKAYYQAGNFIKALPFLRTAAEAGDGIAASYVVSIYGRGLGGVREDDIEAVKWFQKGVAAGDALGMAGLAAAYSTGRGGMPTDFTKAATLYRKAADAGLAQGFTGIGVLYASGVGGLPKNDAQAASWYLKGAQRGDPIAMVDIGAMYEDGRGISKDEAAAVNWYEKAAKEGNADAMSNLANMYRAGRGSLARNDVQAAYWYRKAADAGSSDGMNALGVIYATGRGTPKDEAQAAMWYTKGAALGNAQAMSNLGVMCLNGSGGLPKDEVNAVRWFRKAADAGAPRGMTNLASMYAQGRGGLARDIQLSLDWYRKAASIGDPVAKDVLQRAVH